ncbi:MAG: Smr/MutS family protein [Pseudomonadota bacterium]
MRRAPGAKARPTISEADLEAFRDAMQDVARIAPSDRVEHAPERPAPVPHQTLNDEREVLVESLSGGSWEATVDADGEMSFVRPGLPRQLLRKLRRGHWVIQDEVDLHGLTRETARERTAEFLRAALRRGYRCVRIVHGKGLGSKNKEPVLKAKVRHWLMQRDDVLAFTPARPADGGTGAVVVLLRG